MTWEVIGANRETGEDVRILIEADDEESAKRRANRMGVMVSSIRPLDADDSMAGEQLPVLVAVGQARRVQPPPPAPATGGETTHYEARGILVTNKRFVVGTKTYAVANISSVQILTIEPDMSGLGTMVMLTFVAFCVGALIAANAEHEAAIYGWAFIAVGAVLGAIALSMLFSAHERYAARIATNAGEIDALVHDDKIMIQLIITALNLAIMAR